MSTGWRDRYSRQTAFPCITEAGQTRLAAGTVVIIGCGALGCHSALWLARAGVGTIRIIDRDFPEYHNLQRQVLFDESDVKAQVPKAVAAERHLRAANSTIDIKGIVADANYTNVEKFCRAADVIVDGLDNFDTRLLLNDVAMKLRIPYVYGSAVAATGMTMTIVPGKTACYRCIRPVLPDRATLPTCETAGVVSTAPAIVAALQATETLKLLVGSEPGRGITMIDVWKGIFDRIAVQQRPDCPACHGRYEVLEQRHAFRTTSFCGQSRAVQVVDANIQAVRLDELASKLQNAGTVSRDEHSLRLKTDDIEIIVFPDGRAIVRNTTDEALARELYLKYITANVQKKGQN